MSENTASNIVAVALIALMLTSSVPTTAAATTTPSPSTGGGDDVDTNLDAVTSSTTDSQPSQSTSTPDGQDTTYADSSVNGDDAPLDTHPDVNNLSISSTVENTSDGWLHLNVTVNGSIDKNQYPRNYPIAVSVKDADANGSHIITRTVILSPDRSTNFSDTNNLSSNLAFHIRFRQDETSTHNLTLTATSTRDIENESTSTSLSPTVEGASSSSAATGSASVTDGEVNEPPSEVSFVSRFRASNAGTDPQYLESYSIPLSNPSGTVRNFVDLRSATGNASEFRASGGSLRVATSTLGIPSGDTQTLVITYRSLSDKDVNATPVTALGKPIHPGRSNSYVLPTDPASSDHPNCQAGEAYDMCVYTLSDQEKDRVNEHHELYVRYTGGDMAAVKVFCQAVITGTLRKNMSACGKGPADDYTDGYIYNMTGREHESGDPWQRNPLVIVGNGSDVNLTLGNAGTQPFDGRVRLFARENVSYTLREALTWDEIQTPARPTPRSCADVKAIDPDAGNGTYDIDPDGPNNSQYDLMTVHCDMTTQHNGKTGGWTGISIQQARNEFGGSVSAIQGRDAESGYVDGYRPYVVDTTSGSGETHESGSSFYLEANDRAYSNTHDTSSGDDVHVEFDVNGDGISGGEWLKAYYKDSSGNWEQFAYFDETNDHQTDWSTTLPSDALHSDFQVMFVSDANCGCDTWNVDNFRIWTTVTSSGHVGRYQFNVPFGYDAFYTNNFKIRSGSYLVGGDTSEIGDRIFGWGDSYSHPGDFAMGTPNESGPTTSYARYGTHRHNYGNDQIETFTDNHNPFGTVYSENFRLQWMEDGRQDEGWVWWNGRVYFRGPISENLSTKKLDWSGTRTFSNSYQPNHLRLSAGPIDLNNNSIDVTVKNTDTGGTYTTRVTESDLNSSGYLVVEDLSGSNDLSNAGSTYTVSITAVEEGFPQPTVDEARLLAREDSSTSTEERTVSLAPGEQISENFPNLSVGSKTGSAEYIALLCGDAIDKGDCTTTNYDDKSTITIRVAAPGAENCPVSGRDCTPPNANADSPVVEMPIIGYTEIRNGIERKQLVNEPETLGGPEWRRSDEPVSTATGTQTERATVYNVTINSGNPVADYEDDARSKLSKAPTDEGWERIGEPQLVENQTEVKIQSTAPKGDNWVRSRNPVSKSETGYEYQWFEVTTKNQPTGTHLAEGQSSSNWHIVKPYESREMKKFDGRVVQIVDPDDCAPIEQTDGRSGCYQAETLSERQNRSPSEIVGATEGVNKWHRSTSEEPRTVRREVGGKKMYSWTDPGNPWRKIEENTFPEKDLYRKPVYENRTLYTWVKADNITEYKYKRPTTKPVYKWTKTTYDLVYTFESSTDGEPVYEWTRPDMKQEPVFGNQTVWLDSSKSHDGQTGLKTFEWEFANGQEVTGQWSNGFQGVDSQQVECPTGYSSVTSERPAQAGAILVEKCENESLDAEFIKRVGLRLDGSKYDGETTTYGPELTVTDAAGNTDSANANVTLVPCKKDVANCTVSNLRPNIEVVDATRKVDAKHGMVSLTVRVSGPETLPTPWRLSVKPADRLSGISGCPANYHPRSVNQTVDTTETTQRIENAQKCVRNDPLDLLPEGSPEAPKSFVLKERNQSDGATTEWIHYAVPAGAARACPTQYTANTTGSTYECIPEDGLGENITLGTRTGSTGAWDFQNVAAGNYSTCPEGYNTREEYVSASESIQGEETTQVECERPDKTTFSLKERFTVKDYQRISSSSVSEIQECAPNYGASTVGKQVNCIKQSGPGPTDYVLRDGTKWLHTPAGAWRECPRGWKTSKDEFRDEQIVCIDTDSDEWFILTNLDRGAWTTQSVPSEAIDYAPDAKKTVWESEYINGGTEQVTVLINPRKNDAINIGENTFTFTAKPVGASDSSKVDSDLTLQDTVRVELCDAKRGSSVPKTHKRSSDCIGLDSDYDGVPDWAGSKALLEQYPELYRLNDVCPRNSSLPKDSDEPLTDLSDEELRDLYNDPKSGSPCSDGRRSGEDGELYTVTWDSSDWDATSVENQSGIRHTNRPGRFNDDIDYPYNDSLALGYTLKRNASVNEDLIAYYTLNERDAKGDGQDLSYDTENKSESDYERTVVDIWRKNAETYNGYHWSRNPCPAKDSLDTLLGYDCPRSPFFDAPPDKYGNFSQGSYINHAWVKSYQDESDEDCPTLDGGSCQGGFAGDIPAYYMPNDMWRKDKGMYGTGSYAFYRHNFIELSGGYSGDTAHHKDSPSNDLSQKILNESNGSYTISFWYKAPKVKNNALANWSDIRDDENTIFSVNRRNDNFDNIQLDAIRTEEDTVGIGWPTKAHDGRPRWKQQKLHEEDGKAPGFFVHSDKDMLSSSGQPTGWHHITIVRGTQLDAAEMPTGEYGVALYVDGQLVDVYSHREQWSTGFSSDISGAELNPNQHDRQQHTIATGVDENGICPYDCIAPSQYVYEDGDQMPGIPVPHGDFGPHARFIFGAEWDSKNPWGSDLQWETDSGLVGWVDEIRVYNDVKQRGEVENLAIEKGHIQPQVKRLPEQRKAVYSNQLSLKLDGKTNGGVVNVDVTPCPNGNCQPSNGQEVTYQTDADTADAIPLDEMNLEQPTNRYRINVTLLNTQTTAESTPVVNSVKLQFSPLPERQSCRDYINQTPGIYGTDGSQEIVVNNSSGALVEDTVHCDQTIQGGGWTRFWWYQENQTSESGPDPTISGSLFEKSMEECQVPDYSRADACNGQINWPDDTNDTAVLVRVVDESGQVHYGAWELNNSSNSVSAAATEAFTTGATQAPSEQCWDAYHYSYSYASFGSDNESCKSTFEYTGDYLYLGNTTTNEDAFAIALNSDGTVSMYNALGVTDVQSIELYFREDSPPEKVLNGTKNGELMPDANARVRNGTSGWTKSVVADNGQSLEFDASETDPTDDNLSDLTYEWDFGDGTVTTTDSLKINHTYNETGDYTVYLTVTDPDGYSSIDEVTVTVENAPPENVQIDAPSTVSSGETFSASATADDPDGDSLTYEWDTDNDGTVDKTGQSITHSYSSSGDKTLSVYVSDGNGHTTKESTTITVEKNLQPLLINEHYEGSNDYMEVVATEDNVNLDNYKVVVTEETGDTFTLYTTGSLNKWNAEGWYESEVSGNNPTNAGDDWKVELVNENTGTVIDCVAKGPTFEGSCGFYVAEVDSGSDDSYYRSVRDDTNTSSDWDVANSESEDSLNPGQ